jgi:hypothetical protein
VKLVTLALTAIILAGCQSQNPSPDISSLDWNLEIDQPIRQLEEILADLEQQQPRNYTIANISFLYKVKLHLVFERYLDSLPADERSMVIKEQRDWMDLHRQGVDKAYADYEGGTFAGYNAGLVSVEMLKGRIGKIQKRIH